MFHYNDQVPLTLVSGSGGSGCLSFHRVRVQPRGGPDGGNGGQGGSVFLKSSFKIKNLDHLISYAPRKAENGGSGQSQKKAGKKGKDLVVFLPLGTLVRNKKEDILQDFTRSKEILFLEGGRGGKGNAFFKTSLNQAPRHTQKGEKGVESKIILEFKPLIDLALIGEVNSGKSSFFNQVSRGKSPIGSYPYTTLRPYVADFKDAFKFTKNPFLMDIPGLDQGAYKSIRKGAAFLRSIQRAQILLHFIDSNHESPLASQKKIEQELELFDKKYSSDFFEKMEKKKRFLILSRVDLLEKKKRKQVISEIQKKSKLKVFPISTHNNEGIKELIVAIKKEIKK